MNQEDFERLKAVCEKEGFELYKHEPATPRKRVLISVFKKDIWDGVEYVKSSDGTIYKILANSENRLEVEGGHIGKKIGKPSTESAYVDQLKKKAFFRYGEIKEGDRFDCSEMGRGTSPITFNQGQCHWHYIKSDDRLRKGYFDLYEKGQWATKVQKRIEVGLKGGGMDKSSSGLISLSCKFQIYPCPTYDMSLSIISQFLAQQLEKYLNGEIKEPCTGNCGMNYCDENGCTERKRAMVDDLDQDNIRSYPKGGIRFR